MFECIPMINITKSHIILGDCVEKMKELPENSFDIIIADPPYNIGKDFGNNSDKQTMPEYIQWSKKWIAECQRLLKNTGTMFIYGFDERLAYLSVLLPIEQQRWLIWYYTNKNIPSLNFWQRSHESIICYWKKTPLFNRDEVREPYTSAFLKGSAGRIRPATEGRFSHNTSKTTIYCANARGALPRDVINCSTLAGGASIKERLMYCKTCQKIIAPNERKKHQKHIVIIHPTQKPLALSDKLIKSSRPQGEFKVLIPFCGSGSECLATLKNGGIFTAFEINSDYVHLAHHAIQNYANSLNAFGVNTTNPLGRRSKVPCVGLNLINSSKESLS